MLYDIMDVKPGFIFPGDGSAHIEIKFRYVLACLLALVLLPEFARPTLVATVLSGSLTLSRLCLALATTHTDHSARHSSHTNTHTETDRHTDTHTCAYTC